MKKHLIYRALCIIFVNVGLLNIKLCALPPNGEFELKNAKDSSKALHWKGGYVLSSDASTGANSAYCHVNENMKPAMCDAISLPFNLSHLRKYVLSGMSKGNERFVYIQQLDKDKKIIKTDYWKIPESFDWKKFQFEFNSMENAVWGKIYLRVFKSGKKAYFDNIKITDNGEAEKISREKTYLEKNQPYNRLSNSYETPHIKWAKPYAKGVVKALTIAPTWTQRETVELAQRMSLDYAPLMTKSRSEFAGKGYLTVSSKTVNDDFNRIMNDKQDIIIIGGMDWKAFPEKVKEKIMAKVSSGCGLVFTNISPGCLAELKKIFAEKEPGAAKLISSGIPLDLIPLLNKKGIDKRIQAFKYGKGRVVLLNYGGKKSCWHSLTPAGFYLKEKNFFYEYFMAVLIRACLWAADKLPETYFQVDSDLKNLPRGPVNLSCNVFSQTKCDKSKLDINVIDSEGNTTYNSSMPLSLENGANSIKIHLPALKNGTQIVNCKLIDKEGNVLDWASIPLKINSSASIESLSASKMRYKAGETLESELKISNVGNDNGQYKCVLSLYDGLNRLLVRKSIKSETTNMISMELPAPLVTRHELRVELLDELGTVDEKNLEFFIDKSENMDEFKFSGWSYALNGYPSILMLRQMKNSGFDSILEASGMIKAASNDNYYKLLASLRANLDFDPQGWNISPAREDDEVIKNKDGLPECKKPLTSEKYKKNMCGALQYNMNNYSKIYELPNYSLSDEACLSISFKDVCFSPSALESFQAWAKEKYGTLENANKVWGSDFKDWKEARPQTYAEALRKKNFAGWFDHRTHMENVLLNTLVLGKKTINAVSPKTKVGFEGAVGLDYPITFVGYNWPEIMKKLDYIGTYGGVPMELARSFGGKECALNTFTGSYSRSSLEMMKIKPWEILFHNGNLLQWWTVFPTRGNGGASAFTPGLVPLPWLETTTTEVNKIKSGIDKLILNSHRDNDPIAIHYSNLCAHASIIDNEHQNWANSMRAFKAVLEDSGFQYDYIATKDIENGGLNSDKYKVLILPYSQVLSEKEASEIKSFVSNGGLLIADMMPGVRDVHGNPRKNNPMNTLFSSMLEANRKISGKGNAMLIGKLLRDYVGEKEISGPPIPGMEGERSDSSKESEIFTRIIALSGISPKASIKDLHGKNIPNIETIYYRFGGIPIYAILPHYIHYKNPRKVKIKFPEKNTVRDLLNNKNYSDCDEIETEIRPGEARLFAILPKESSSLKLEGDKAVSVGGEISVTVKRLDSSYKTVIFMEIFGPDNKKINFLSQKKIISEEGSFKIPLALNSANGEYRILFCDILSGNKKEITIEATK